MSTPFPISPAMGRRNHTLAPSTLSQTHASPRSASPYSYEGPLMSRASKTTHGGGYGSSRERHDSEARHSQPPSRAPTPKSREVPRTNALIDEIKRLTAACEAHEREIRASQTTISRQLQDWSQNLDLLNSIDTHAEKLAANIQQISATTETEHAQKISAILAPFEERVEDMAVEFAPWNTYASEYETEEGMDGRRGSIPRIKAMDGIARLEKQAEVVTLYYEGEEARLRKMVQAKRAKRNFWNNIVSFLSIAVAVIGIIIVLLLWMFEWR